MDLMGPEWAEKGRKVPSRTAKKSTPKPPLAVPVRLVLPLAHSLLAGA
jgi:hypothetical protein